MQSREGYLEEFFSHEVQSFPPSLSEFGKLYLPGTKSEFMKCLEPLHESTPPETFSCKVLDGAVIVHCLSIAGITTFKEYAEKAFMPHLQSHLQGTERLDVVWDTYRPDSLKESTCQKRGKGVRRKVSGETKLPRNWSDFLHDSSNKKELFDFLTYKVANVVFPEGKAVYITSEESVLTVCSSSPMPNCNHEEADTSIVVHVPHALQQGLTTVQVRTVDTDVVGVLIGVLHKLLLSSPRLIFGSPLESERTTDFTASMLCPPALAQKGHKHYQCFTRDFWMRHNLCFLGNREEVVLSSLDGV